MPIKKSAMKALRQDKKRVLRNTRIKKNIKELVKKSKKLINKKDKDKSTEKIKEAIRSIDRAVQKKILKKNTGARKKSRLMKGLNQLGK